MLPMSLWHRKKTMNIEEERYYEITDTSIGKKCFIMAIPMQISIQKR